MSKNVNTNIKGGGRAFLSDAAEESLVAYLMSRSGKQLPSSKHHREREHKRFLKDLVKKYQSSQLMKKFNSNENDKETTASSGTDKSTGKSSSSGSKNSSGNVRINLIEAMYGKKTKSGKEYKEGTKKVMVFPRSSAIQEVMKKGQAKLRMKKKPVRCFIVEEKMEVNLVADLSGVSDDAVVYITSQEPPKDENEHEEVKAALEEEAEDNGMDSLDRVKAAYLQNNTRRPFKQGLTRPAVQSHPDFDLHFAKLDPISEERSSLPAAACREMILRTVQENRVVVICGATGCGKSTQIPQFLWEGMKASGCKETANIIVTQPRRVAAMSLANRVADEMGSTKPGESGSLVGYNVRLDRAVSEDARVVYCTVGILFRMLVSPRQDSDADQASPLSTVSHVVIDEVHERDMNTDFVLTLLRSIVQRNPNIRIILMSATASATKFVEYFKETLGAEPAIISIPGRTFPVDIHWLEDCEKRAASKVTSYADKIDESSPQSKRETRALFSPRSTQKIDNQFIKDLVCALVREQRAGNSASSDKEKTDGAILIFLPGKGEIEALAKILYNDPITGDRDGCSILKLHSKVPRHSQQAVFRRAQAGCTKIVLSTNIAETSVTIPDVTHVIDTGRVKENRFNPSTRIKELVTVWTSRASIKQRSGRAGRTSAGKCWRLYSEKFSTEYMLEQTPPEMLRTPLDELILQVCLLFEQRRDQQTEESRKKFPKGVCPKKFLGNTPDPPSNEHLDEACKHLLEVDAVRTVSSDPLLYRLTPLGYHLSKLPMDTKVGKVLVVGCMLGCLDGALTVAASLSCRKSCFLHRWGSSDAQFEAGSRKRNQLIASGFGGETWVGGTSKGDLIATIAMYNQWSKLRTYKKKAVFAHDHALDNLGLNEISQLRHQFLDCLLDAGFVSRDLGRYNNQKDDALLTSCCFVAGLYPNICTLMRSEQGGRIKGGRLLTKDGDICRPQASSFQRERVQNAAQGKGKKDVYAVYHAKHRSVGTGARPGEVFLSEVSFVSRMALLLFSGELEIRKEAIILDDWLKFKIGDKGIRGAVLILALRDELDRSMLRHIESNGQDDEDTETLISVVRQLLSNE